LQEHIQLQQQVIAGKIEQLHADAEQLANREAAPGSKGGGLVLRSSSSHSEKAVGEASGAEEGSGDWQGEAVGKLEVMPSLPVPPAPLPAHPGLYVVIVMDEPLEMFEGYGMTRRGLWVVPRHRGAAPSAAPAGAGADMEGGGVEAEQEVSAEAEAEGEAEALKQMSPVEGCELRMQAVRKQYEELFGDDFQGLVPILDMKVGASGRGCGE
jgi:hypothetical protein